VARQFTGIIGHRAAKSTLLGMVGGLDTPSNGRVYIDSVDITDLDERALTRVRNEKIGFVFQFFNLIPTLTALENVALPIQFARRRKFGPARRAKELLTLLGLEDRMDHRPSQLSGGQQQRVALARAAEIHHCCLRQPRQPRRQRSGDESAARGQKQTRTAIIIVTHNMDVAAQVDRLVTLVDGQIANDVDPRSTAQMAAIKMLKDKRSTGELVIPQNAGK
jgi:putative ABC transport system ATP-binding protein